MNKDKGREEFEVWFDADQLPCESDWFKRDPDSPDEYLFAPTQFSWDAWQAAQAAMQPEIDKLFECQVERGNYQAELFAVRQQLAAANKTIEQLQAKVAEAKREALEEAAVIAQTNSDSNVDGGDYACGCCYEIRRMAADLQGK